MDAVSIITAIIVIGIFMLIFILPSIGVKRLQKRMKTKLHTLAEQSQAEITMSSILGDSIIGIDDNKQLVFFFKHEKNNEKISMVDLKKIRNCKMLNQTKSIKSKSENFNQFEKLGLQFIPIDKNLTDIVWEFYNAEENPHLNIDLRSLEKWCDLLNMKLK